MAYVQIRHSCPISPDQQAAFAAALTSTYRTFNLPNAAVHTQFLLNDPPLYVNGAAQHNNTVHAEVFFGSYDRSEREDQEAWCALIMSAWHEHVGSEDAKGRQEDERGLHNVFVYNGGNVFLQQGEKKVVSDWME